MSKDMVNLSQERDYTIRSASIEDLTAVKELLRERGLPTVGVDETINTFLVADKHKVIGTVGVLYDGEKALIRSFAVTSKNENRGIGLALIKQVLAEIKRMGAAEVYLLTETAAEYFKRFGFFEINRDDIPQRLLKESGLAQACPCSSQCMKFLL